MEFFYPVIMMAMAFLNEYADTRLKRISVLIVVMSVSLLAGKLSGVINL